MNIVWEIQVPVFKNKMIVKQLAIAAGIPFGSLLSILLIIKAFYGVLLVGVLLLATLLMVMILFKGTYRVQYILSEKGILCENQPEQAKKIKKMSLITIILSLFTKNPVTAGVAMLSASSTSMFIPWIRVRGYKSMEKQKCILVLGSIFEKIVVFCNEETYLTVNQIFKDKCPFQKKKDKGRR